jgi:SIR2-like domain
MSVRVMEESRQLPLAEHLSRTSGLDNGAQEAIAALARQLPVPAILPVVGAGASWDCGVRIANEIGEDLLADYLANAEYEPHDTALTKHDLGEIAEKIFEKKGPERVVEDLGFPEESRWRPAAKMGDHFCVYCVLARMAREEFMEEAFGFNYDCGAEAGLEAEGFLYGEAVAGQQWVDYARVVADGAAMVEMEKQGYLLVKAHGCAVRYRELAAADPRAAAEGIVIRRRQLEDWKKPGWSLNAFRASAEKKALMLIGFSGQDSKFSAELDEILTAVYAANPGNGRPRVVAIDLDPSAKAIQKLINTGLDGKKAEAGVATSVCTHGSTATGAMLVLLAELIAYRLETEAENQGVGFPKELDPRLASLIVTAPAMLRWALLADEPSENSFIQLANLMATRGYVPLTKHATKSVKLMAARAAVRAQLDHSKPESSAEAVAGRGFIVDAAQGVAYMPVGIKQEKLAATCRQGDELEMIRRTLEHPSHLDCILVSGDGSVLRGVNLATGEEVRP